MHTLALILGAQLVLSVPLALFTGRVIRGPETGEDAGDDQSDLAGILVHNGGGE